MKKNAGKLFLTHILPITFFLTSFVNVYSQSRGFDELIIGKGGGFANSISGFLLDFDGKIYRCSGNIDCRKDTLLKSLDHKALKKLQKFVSKNTLTKIYFQEPSNIYNFIQISKDGKINKIIWNPFDNRAITKKLNKIYMKIESFVK
jgi:hypothetical protein